VSKSEKLQDVEWVGKVLNAARMGDAAAMKELLQHKKAKQRIGKLRKPLPEVGPSVLWFTPCWSCVTLHDEAHKHHQ
jgi:hypothetical protein